MLPVPGVYTSGRTVPLRVKPMSVKKVAPWELQPPSDGPGITRSDAAQNGMIWYSQDLITCSTCTYLPFHANIAQDPQFTNLYTCLISTFIFPSGSFHVKHQISAALGPRAGPRKTFSIQPCIRAIKHDMTLNLKTY